eukprot:2728591-Rhodomonas_salina.2
MREHGREGERERERERAPERGRVGTCGGGASASGLSRTGATPPALHVISRRITSCIPCVARCHSAGFCDGQH